MGRRNAPEPVTEEFTDEFLILLEKVFNEPELQPEEIAAFKRVCVLAAIGYAGWIYVGWFWWDKI